MEISNEPPVKRPLTMSQSDADTTKKPKSDSDVLTAKQKKKAARARKLGLAYEFVNDELVIHPKIFFKPLNDFASMKDARGLLLTALSRKQSKLAEIPDFPGILPIRKTILIDVPIYDPNEMGLPMEARVLSQTSAPLVYQQMTEDPLFPFIQQDVLGLVSAAGFDQYKRVHDRFLDLLEVPLSKGELKKKREEEDKGKHMMEDTLKFEDFPIPKVMDPESELEDGWVDTLPGTGLQPKNLVALDCEMCKTVDGYAVTRVALIDRNHNQLINEFVMPSEEITDYVTHISGVSAESLKGVSTTLADIQKKIQTYVTDDTILVGHGLVNDMKCLKMRHPHIIDTAVIYHHKNGPPYKPSLRDLTTRYLKRTIQVRDEDKKPGDVQGHDPCEDAIASLELLERKLVYGLNYGLAGLSQVETVLDYLSRNGQTGAVIESHAPLSMLMKRKLAEHECYFSLDTDEQVADKVIEQHAQKQLVIARLELPQPTEQERRVKFMQLFQDIYQHMEQDTAFCITTGYRSNARREALREKRVDYKKKLKQVGLSEIPMEERWSIEDEHELEQIADATRRGFIFASVKQ
ncbi:hypothetical protein INT47_009524 [Mucor saturninus]|uniref:Exonuclease domain-containing protein n=1 Tax=Mucor saturninus TaxID=64648 RepID=A0A8H7R624_9FUNG|nr:hypothetical protein INT47_009524 [Mucor saturninus]